MQQQPTPGSYDYQIPQQTRQRPAQEENIFSAMMGGEDAYVGRVVVYDDTKLVSIKDHNQERPNPLVRSGQPQPQASALKKPKAPLPVGSGALPPKDRVPRANETA